MPQQINIIQQGHKVTTATRDKFDIASNELVMVYSHKTEICQRPTKDYEKVRCLKSVPIQVHATPEALKYSDEYTHYDLRGLSTNHSFQQLAYNHNGFNVLAIQTAPMLVRLLDDFSASLTQAINTSNAMRITASTPVYADARDSLDFMFMKFEDNGIFTTQENKQMISTSYKIQGTDIYFCMGLQGNIVITSLKSGYCFEILPSPVLLEHDTFHTCLIKALKDLIKLDKNYDKILVDDEDITEAVETRLLPFKTSRPFDCDYLTLTLNIEHGPDAIRLMQEKEIFDFTTNGKYYKLRFTKAYQVNNTNADLRVNCEII